VDKLTIIVPESSTNHPSERELNAIRRIVFQLLITPPSGTMGTQIQTTTSPNLSLHIMLVLEVFHYLLELGWLRDDASLDFGMPQALTPIEEVDKTRRLMKKRKAN